MDMDDLVRAGEKVIRGFDGDKTLDYTAVEGLAKTAGNEIGLSSGSSLTNILTDSKLIKSTLSFQLTDDGKKALERIKKEQASKKKEDKVENILEDQYRAHTSTSSQMKPFRVGPDRKTSMEFPRRNQTDKMVKAEKAILDAMRAVEEMPADVRLTDAVILLGKAKDKVSDFVDGVASPPT